LNTVQLVQVNKAIDICLEKLGRKPRTLKNFHRLMNQGQRKLLPRVKEWMAESIAEMRAGLPKMKGRTPAQKTKSIADWKHIREQGVIILKPVILELLERFDLIGVEAVKWASMYCAKLVTEITDKTMEGIRSYIAAGINAGKSGPAIARELRPLVGLTEKQIFAVANYHEKLILERPEYTAARQSEMAEVYARRLHRDRAMLIARTETREALWEGVFEGYEQMGIDKVEGVSDPDACDWCLDNINGQVMTTEEARAIDTHPGCECAWVMA